MKMGTILNLWMDVILLLTFQRDMQRRRPADASGGQFNPPADEANPCSARSGRSAGC